MIDIWRKPFGFQYLAFGNLHLAIGIAVGAPLPSFGTFWHFRSCLACAIMAVDEKDRGSYLLEVVS